MDGYKKRIAATASAPPASWHATNAGADDGSIPANVSDNVLAAVTRRVGEARRRCEEVRAADVRADRERRGGRAARSDDAEHDEQQAEGCDDFREPEAASGSLLRRQLDHRLGEHEVAEDGAGRTASDLRGDVRGGVACRQPADRAVHERDDGIEVRPRDGSEREDQCREPGRGRRCVLEQLEPDVFRTEPFGRDARADDDRDEQRSAEELGEGSTGDRRRRWRAHSSSVMRRPWMTNCRVQRRA